MPAPLLRLARKATLTLLVGVISSVTTPAVPRPQQSSSSQTTAPEPEPKKPRKVWTNENLGEVGSNGVSQVGTLRKGAVTGKSPATPANAQLVNNFRKQIAVLEAQRAGVEKQISDLKDFNRGEAAKASGLQLHKSYTMEPVDDQIRKLQEKQKEIAALMDSVFDAARKKGIQPGQLR